MKLLEMPAFAGLESEVVDKYEEHLCEKTWIAEKKLFVCHHISMVFHPHSVVFCLVNTPSRIKTKWTYPSFKFRRIFIPFMQRILEAEHNHNHGQFLFHDRLKTCKSRVKG